MNDSSFSRCKAPRLVWLAGLAMAVLVGCTREATRWEVEVALPLVDDQWTWSDVIMDLTSDNGLQVETGAPGVIRFNGPVAEWNIASLTQLPDTIVEQELTPEFTGGPFPVPPGAVLLDTEEDIVFQGIDQAFTSIVLESGRIEYLVESSTDGYVDLQYLFPSVTIAGVPVELKVVLPPSNGVDFQIEEGTLDLAGAIIDLTGVSGNEINRIASQLIIGTPANIADTAQVYGTDSIRVRMHFQELFVREVAGYFGQEIVSFDVEQSVFNPADFPGGFVQIQPTRAILEFHNTIAADLRLQLDQLAVDGIQVNHPVLGTPQLITRAAWNGEEVEPAVWQLDLLETQPAIFDLLSYLPQSVSLEGEGLLNPLGDVSGGHDYFDTRQPPALYLDFEWPLSGAVENFEIRRVLDLEGTDLAGFDGELVVRLTNGFPVNWDLDAEWIYADESLAPFDLTGTLGSFPNDGPLELRIPMDEQRVKSSAELLVNLRMRSDGPVEFSGRERIRLQMGFEGFYQVEVP